MNNIKEYLKMIGMSKQQFANEIKLSRPTLDSYISIYENGMKISKERYQIIFEQLFGEELETDEFYKRLEHLKGLLERDERLGTDKLEALAADYISKLRNMIFDDMSQEDWNPKVYDFIRLLIGSYRKNIIMKNLAEYFVYLNSNEKESVLSDEQIPYFVQYYKAFNRLRNDAITYAKEDYEALLKRREEVIIERKKRQEERIKKLIAEVSEELEQTQSVATEADILEAILKKL